MVDSELAAVAEEQLRDAVASRLGLVAGALAERDEEVRELAQALRPEVELLLRVKNLRVEVPVGALAGSVVDAGANRRACRDLLGGCELFGASEDSFADALLERLGLAGLDIGRW